MSVRRSSNRNVLVNNARSKKTTKKELVVNQVSGNYSAALSRKFAHIL